MTTAVSAVALVIGLGGVLWRPASVPVWSWPLAAGASTVATGATTVSEAGAVLGLLAPVLGFLVVIVPIGVALDRDGFFDAVARRISGPWVLPGLWATSALVTALLNLDAAVVLLTPLAVRVAQRHGLPVLAVAAQPALLAVLASTALPVSNLTNLILAEELGLDAVDFVVELGPATVVAVGVGYLAWRRHFGIAAILQTSPAGSPGAPVDDRRTLARGGAVIVVLTAGFTFGDVAGLPAWAVAAVGLALVASRLPPREVVRAVPAEVCAVAAGLGVVVAGFGVAAEALTDGLGDGTGPAGVVRAVAVSGVAAALSNNLPAALLALDAVRTGPGLVWPVLLGLAVAPAFVVTGSLSGLLWLDVTRRLGVEVGAWRYSRFGVAVAGPALVAATLVLVVGSGLRFG